MPITILFNQLKQVQILWEMSQPFCTRVILFEQQQDLKRLSKMLYRKTALFGWCEDDTPAFEQTESPFVQKSKTQLNGTPCTVCRRQYLHFRFLFHLLNWGTMRYFPESHRTMLENYGALSKVQRTFLPYLLATQKVANTVNSNPFQDPRMPKQLTTDICYPFKTSVWKVHFRSTHS